MYIKLKALTRGTFLRSPVVVVFFGAKLDHTVTKRGTLLMHNEQIKIAIARTFEIYFNNYNNAIT